MSRFWIGWCKGFPLRYSGYSRRTCTASFHIGPLCIQWPMPEKKWA